MTRFSQWQKLKLFPLLLALVLALSACQGALPGDWSQAAGAVSLDDIPTFAGLAAETPEGELPREILHAFSDIDESVVIDISDDGEPIPPDIATHIFIPFFTTKDEGSGIGLSISRQIMRVSNGSIALLPDRHDGQTTFRLRFQ